MFRLTFLVSLIPFVLGGCWDFAALTDKGARDGGIVVDLYMCGTERNANREDCANGVDDNQDCLVDCEDPQCKDAIRCVDPTDQMLGYGSRNPNSFTCAANQTSTNLKQNLSLNADCGSGGGCGCLAGQCASTLRWADNQANCMAGTFAGMTPVTNSSATGTCVAAPAPVPMQNSYFRLDPITTASCPRDTTKNGTLQVTWGTEEKLCTVKGTCETLDCVQRAGHKCLAFPGDWPTCPAAFPNKVNTWVQSVTDNRTCACTCTAAGNSCTITGTEARLTDSNMCMGGTQRTFDIANGMVNMCVTANLGGGASVAAINFGVRATCNAAGVAATDLQAETQAGRVTTNGPITTCCAP